MVVAFGCGLSGCRRSPGSPRKVSHGGLLSETKQKGGVRKEEGHPGGKSEDKGECPWAGSAEREKEGGHQ